MASIKIQGDTSGEITISAPAVAGTNTITLPASTGTMITSDNISSYASSFFSEQVTFSTNTTVTSANAGKVYYTSTDNLTLTLPALPGGTDTLAYAIINDSDTDLFIATNTPASEYIGPWLGYAYIGSKEEAIIVSIGTNKWKLIGTNATSSITLVDFTASGTYTPDSTVSSFLVCLGGAGSGTDGNLYTTTAAAGGSYGEKFYASPTGSYSVTIGAGGAGGLNAGGSSNFNSELTVNGTNVGTPGTVTNADYSSTGGSAGSGTRCGGGGGAGRAGNGGSGSSYAGPGNGGGGTGGNNASSSDRTGGAAATTQAAGVYNLSALFTSFSFNAGSNGSYNTGGYGAYGRQNITKLDGTTDIISGGSRGTPCTSSARAGDNATCTIIEFRG